MRPTDIDLSFVPSRAPETFTVHVDDEAVILDEVHIRLHHLNPTAALLWSCCDGDGSLAHIASDVADAFGTDPAAARVDILALARTLGAAGLLAGVEPEPKPETELEPGPEPE